jgi:hypothetical protein
MPRLQTSDKYAGAELKKIIDQLNQLIELKPGAVKRGEVRKIQGETYECSRTPADIIVLRYYGDDVSITSELAMLVELAGYRRPTVVTSGVLTFSAIMPQRN